MDMDTGTDNEYEDENDTQYEAEIDTSLRTMGDPASRGNWLDLYAGVLAMTEAPKLLSEDEDEDHDWRESQVGFMEEDTPQSMEGSVEYRPWASLPDPALALIFQKLGVFQVFFSAQLVCRCWRLAAAANPFGDNFDMRAIPPSILYHDDQERLANSLLRMLSAHSSGRPISKLHLVSVTGDFLLRIPETISHSIESFSLICSHQVPPKSLLDFLSRCPLLQELHIYLSLFSLHTFGDIGRACPSLKCLWVDGKYEDGDSGVDSDDEYRVLRKCNKWGGYYYTGSSDSDSDSDSCAFSVRLPDSNNCLSDGDRLAMEIADNMPQLRELQLIGNHSLTNKGLHAILDKCLHLESLDIRRCFYVRVDETLDDKLRRIKSPRLSRRSLHT